MIPLESLTPCFQGLIPAWLCTCSHDGMPNAAILSHVDYVDSRHIALSFQFFNKSKRNVSENPRAMVRIYDPDTLQVYKLRLRYARTETQGPIFESMRLRIEAIASYSGLKGIFKLLGADVYEVLSITRLKHEFGVAANHDGPNARTSASGVPFTMKALQDLSDQIHQAPTLDCLLDAILETLEKIFGFKHSMILMPSDHRDRLELIASRGYPQRGVGSEVGFGEGIVGLVAEARKPIRISGMLRHMLYALAVANQAREHGLCPEDRRIPLPGLAHPDSQLGIPLLVRDELIGVLCIETEENFRFHEEDRSYLEVLGGYLALAIQNALFKERSNEGEELPPDPRPAARPAQEKAGPRPRIEVTYYQAEECVLVDREYLVRGLPAKILRKILRERQSDERVEFTNRLLRLDKSLALPDYKDNLESRLILLRRRLEERCPEIRLVRTGRGRFRLELDSQVALSDLP